MESWNVKILVFLATLCLHFVNAQEKFFNPCTAKTTCGECIQTSPECSWCQTEDYDKDRRPRCDLRVVIEAHCKNVVNPMSSSTPDNKKLSEPGAHPDDVVQFVPRQVHLKLRPGEEFPVTVHFRQAKDYPVDLYYLMDLSKSMEDDKDKLALLGDLLAKRMSDITKNFRLGFGSFVDKIVMPYVSTVPEKLKEPCTKCAAPYGFKNHMELSVNTDLFKEEVGRAQVSGNLDAPEGGFDAIMQSMVCDTEIGWRNQSRKLLVFSTDSGFHYAGDGKLGGIVKPNDGLCHLDKTGLYTESTTQDYPSLSQLNQKAIQKKVHIIFAVTANQVPVYTQLSENVEGSFTGKLENDSSNVVELVKNHYDKITSGIELKDTAPADKIQVNYYSSCMNPGGREEKTSVCKGLKVGSTVSFTVKIMARSCPKDRKDWNQTFNVYPVGLNEPLTVNLEMICECECEDHAKEERNSPKCTQGNGTYECGICSCYGDRTGRLCECDRDASKVDADEDACKAPNSSVVCSGRGQCLCSQCDCDPLPNNEKTYGKFCECDDVSCDRHNGKLCSGNGDCKCGKCVCHDGFTQSNCACSTDTGTCKRPTDKIEDPVCSGHGKCVCGKCNCDPKLPDGSGGYQGQYCEDCPTCSPKCVVYRSCVQCKVFESGPYSEDECNTHCNTTNIILVDKAEKINETERICIFKDDDDCKFTFVYGINNNSDYYLRVQRTKDCPPPVNIIMIIIGVIGGILAIGLCLLLIWKLLTTIHDRREFAKFEKERQMAKWDTGENPIFKQATSTFKNPTYGGK